MALTGAGQRIWCGRLLRGRPWCRRRRGIQVRWRRWPRRKWRSGRRKAAVDHIDRGFRRWRWWLRDLRNWWRLAAVSISGVWRQKQGGLLSESCSCNGAVEVKLSRGSARQLHTGQATRRLGFLELQQRGCWWGVLICMSPGKCVAPTAN